MRLQKRTDERKKSSQVSQLCKNRTEVTQTDKHMYLFCVFITLLTILTNFKLYIINHSDLMYSYTYIYFAVVKL